MPQPLVLHALRKADFLSLRFELTNLEITDDGRLVRTDPAAEASIAVHFPPQHIAEAIFEIEGVGGAILPDPPIDAVMAGGTRLVFRLPAGTDSLPLTLEALLDWNAWEPVLAPGAVPDGAVPPPGAIAPQAPGEGETSIEFPWRLELSPDTNGRWRHDRLPPLLGDALQVWRTHLAVEQGAGEERRLADGGDLRALHAIGGPSLPDVGAVSELRRGQIVQLTANHGIVLPAGFDPPTYVPRPIHAAQLTLSALGATVRMEGKWDFPLVPPGMDVEPIGLQQYRHVAAQGRDHFVRTVSVGFLCGTGHRASIVTTTERVHSHITRAGTTPDGHPLMGATAYLIRRSEVVVQQPVIDYEALAAAYAFGGREMPFRSIRLLTLSAPIVTPPEAAPSWLMREDAPDTPVQFKAAAIDLAGNVIEFELPLVYVPIEAIGFEQQIVDVSRFPPGGNITDNGRTAEPGGAGIAFAPAGTKPGSTTLKTNRFTYDIETINNRTGIGALKAAALPLSYVPRFLPAIVGATAVVPAVAEIVGHAPPLAFALDPLYLQHGFTDGNKAESFARFTTPLALELPAQRGGGLARPSSRADGLSRTLGPVANPAQLAAGALDLSSFANAKFLGTIGLLDIIKPGLAFNPAEAAGEEPSQAELDLPGFRLNTPRLVTRRVPEGATAPDLVRTRFLWKPELQDHDVGAILKLKLDQADLLLDAQLERSASGSASAVTLGRLRNAKLSFVGAISVSFAELRFRAEEGKKLEVNASGVDLKFEGPLSFVNSLQSILPADGFDDPPFVTVDGQGVLAGYTLGVPSIGVGIFSLQNIALLASLSVPFTDRPAGVRFGVSERHKPFLLTVSGFGGGGFFAMAVSAKGLEQVEASLEFGGNISLNLVIASGGVYVMAGIYFGLTGSSVTLTGYLRCGGALEVLGLISISVEFYLGFTYRDKPSGGNEVWGQASLVVCVKVAFFSKSVSLSVERRFAGSAGDPSFSQSVTPANWADYLLAFAQ